MKVTYTARKVNLRDNFKVRVEKKLSKFDRIFSDNAFADVVATLNKNNQTVEITIHDGAMVYRAEKTMPEMNDAVDKCIDVLGRQLRKIKQDSQNAFVQDRSMILYHHSLRTTTKKMKRLKLFAISRFR